MYSIFTQGFSTGFVLSVIIVFCIHEGLLVGPPLDRLQHLDTVLAPPLLDLGCKLDKES